jgi:hypothetical protein
VAGATTQWRVVGDKGPGGRGREGAVVCGAAGGGGGAAAAAAVAVAAGGPGTSQRGPRSYQTPKKQRIVE